MNFGDDVPHLKLFKEELDKTIMLSEAFKSWLWRLAMEIEAEGYRRGRESAIGASTGEIEASARWDAHS